MYIVEVSAAGGLSKLVKKVLAREEQWVAKLSGQLCRLGLADQGWHCQVLVFIREQQVEWFRKKLGDAKDVTVLPLEHAIEHWKWAPNVSTPNFSFEADALRRAAE